MSNDFILKTNVDDMIKDQLFQLMMHFKLAEKIFNINRLIATYGNIILYW